MRTLRAMLAITLLASATGAGAADGAADGAALYRGHGCPVCHGPEGRTPAHPTYPRLAGQNRAYLAQQLRDIRSGARFNGSAAVMVESVRDLDDASIDAIAAWLAEHDWTATPSRR